MGFPPKLPPSQTLEQIPVAGNLAAEKAFVQCSPRLFSELRTHAM